MPIMFLPSPFRFRHQTLCPRRPLLAVLFTAMVAAPGAATPAGAEAATKNNGIDYTKPFIYDSAIEPSFFKQPRRLAEERSLSPLARIVRLTAAGRYREALAATHTRLKKDPNAEERAELLRLAARLEARLGNRERAIHNAEALLRKDSLTDGQRADSYLFLSRLYLARKPPNFEKAVEYQRKYNEIAGTPNTGRE